MSPSQHRLGIVTGLAFEADVIRAAAGKLQIQSPLIVCAGPGADRARRAAEELIAARATHLMSFGIAAGLDPAVAVGAAIIAMGFRRSGAADIAADQSWAERIAGALPGAKTGFIADSAEILADKDQKAALRATTAAVVADMESYSVARAAAAAGIPCTAVRVVSDDASQSLPPAAIAGANPDGTVNVWAVLAAILKAPGQIPALIRLGRETAIARRRLRALADLGLARSFCAGALDG